MLECVCLNLSLWQTVASDAGDQPEEEVYEIYDQIEEIIVI